MAIQFKQTGDIAQRTEQRPSKSQVDGSSPSVVSTPKPKRGRPRTGFDKKAYMKEYMRKRRALLHPKPNSVDQNNQPK